MDSILLAAAIAVAVWLFMRRARMTRARQQQRARAAQADETGDAQQSMPRIGTPGTITRLQQQALKDQLFEPSRLWSKEEAALILDAVSYLRTVIEDVTGDANPPLEIQNKVLGLILTDEELREFILDMERNRTREEEAMETPPVPRDQHFERVAGFVRDLWDEG